jgi:hypothetical protein
MKSRKMIYVFAICIILVATLAYAVKSFTNFYSLFGKEGLGEYQDLEEYSSSFGGYSLLIPKNWLVDENDSKYSTREYLQTKIYSTSAKGSIAVYKKQFMNISTEELEKWEKENLADYDQFSRISIETREINGYEGYLQEFTYYRPFFNGGSTYHCYDWVFQNKDLGYMFTMCSDESVWSNISPIFFQIIESIQVE